MQNKWIALLKRYALFLALLVVNLVIVAVLPQKGIESFRITGSNLLDIPMEQLGGDNEVRVLIGPENVAEELRDSSVVLATYDAGENMRGLIGVVGPTRMDYSKVAAKLSFIAAGLSKLLGGGTLPPPGLDNKLIIKGDDTDEHENERPEADGAGNGSGR